MSLIEQIIGKTVIAITAEDIYGATGVANGVFQNCTKLASFECPDSVLRLGDYAFNNCTSLTTIDLNSVECFGTNCFEGCTALSSVNTSRISETSNISWGFFSEAPWLNSFPDGMNLLCDGKILFYPKNITTIEIPASVKTINTGAFSQVAVDTIVIPDTVVRIQGNAFSNSATTKVTIGAGVQKMGIATMNNTAITTWICRQPADMVIDIPTETGDGKGLAHNKNSRSFTLYTDNEMLKAYDWSGDNVTVTIKPLSEAPA